MPKAIAFIPHKTRIKKHKVEYLKAIAEAMDDPWQTEDGRDVRGVQLELANKCADVYRLLYRCFTNCYRCFN